MNTLYGIVDEFGCQTVIHKWYNGNYIDSYGCPVIILTPIKPVQGKEDDIKLEKYLEKNRDKITHGKLAFGPEPVSDGHIVYVFDD